ncbi:unnamed protein product [Discosporangium mesarthrocarpum]
MAWCCRKSSGMGPTLQDQLRDKLSGVELCYPGTHFACLLDIHGQYLSGYFVDEEGPERAEVCTAVAALKRAAEQFAATLGQIDCPVLHISGDNHIFSCYEVGDNVLAFYSHMGSENLRVFNTQEADMQLRELIGDLKIMLSGSMVQSPGTASNSSPPVTAAGSRMV